MPPASTSHRIGLADTFRLRLGWSACAMLAALATLLVLPSDAVIQPLLRSWEGSPNVVALLEMVRPFGRGEVAVLVALLVGAAGRRHLGGQLLTALAISALLTWAIKLGVGRIRPNGAVFSFVSGDTSCIWAVVPLLARSWATGAGVLVVASGVALSRVVFGYHWPADVLGGAAIGLVSGIAGVWMWPARPWAWLCRRTTWIGVAGVALLGAICWANLDHRVSWLRTFLLVWCPALVAWAVWSQLRPRFRHRWTWPTWAPWVVALVLAGALAGLAAAHSLLDRDEPRNALAAEEMLAADSWLVPTFNGEPRLHKPILPYWLMTVALRSGLPVDVACRLPAVLCMLLVVVFSILTARRLALAAGRSPNIVGLVTALVLATSPLVLVSGSAATTDAALLLGISASMWLIIAAAVDGWRWWHLVLIGPMVAWALLSKGPMAILVPVCTLVGAALMLAISRRHLPAGAPGIRPGAWLVLAVGLVVGCALAALWFIPANAETHGVLAEEMLGNHLLKRGLEARESHGGGFWISLPYYLPVLLVACLAWLPQLARLLRMAPGLCATLPGALLLAWAMPVFLSVTLFQTKLPHYLLPMLPPVAILIGCAQTGPIGGAATWWRWGWRMGAGIFTLLAVATLVAVPCLLVVQPTPLPLAPLAAPAIAIGLICWLVVSLAGPTTSWERCTAASAVGMLALTVTLALHLPGLEVFKPAPRIAAAVRQHIPVGIPLTVCGFEEPSLLFYLGPQRGPVAVIHGGGNLLNWCTGDDPAACVATRSNLTEAEKLHAGPLPIRIISATGGYNYSNGKVIELLILARNLP